MAMENKISVNDNGQTSSRAPWVKPTLERFSFKEALTSSAGAKDSVSSFS